jgi:hypothetical protein
MTTAPDLPTWRKSRRSGGEGGNCLELANKLGMARDSKNPATVLTVPLTALLATVKADLLDR